MEKEVAAQCAYCTPGGNAAYCASCGQAFVAKRLTFKSMLHEIFHFFTHLDKGFPYTLKRLITAPGHMQREYIDGKRSKYQKPFSMYFLCGSFCALMMYWITRYMMHHYHEGNTQEATFFNRYWVLLQICMLPVYAFITWLFFKDPKLNYAETVIFQLYVFSLLFLMVALIQFTKFGWPGLQTRYIELPAIVAYSVITNFNFFRGKPKWIILTKTIISIAISFFLASYLQDRLVEGWM